MLQKDLDLAQKQVKTMASELDEQSEVIKGLEEERDEHKARASDQDGLQSEVDRLRGLSSSHEKSLEDSKAEAKTLQGEIKDLLERLRAAEDAKAATRMELEKSKHAYELLQKESDIHI